MINAFPMIFAYDDLQLREGLKKLGLEEGDKDKIVKIGGGAYIRKDHVRDFYGMLQRFDEEIKEAIESDETGEGFVKDMFYYELVHYKYNINDDLNLMLKNLGLTLKEVEKSPKLKNGLTKAIEEYLKNINKK